MRCQSPSPVCSIRAENPAPAQAIRTSTEPQSCSTWAKSRSTARGSVTSAGMARVGPGQASAVTARARAPRPASATRSPAWLSRMATVRPMPLPAPVTSAIRSMPPG